VCGAERYGAPLDFPQSPTEHSSLHVSGGNPKPASARGLARTRVNLRENIHDINGPLTVFGFVEVITQRIKDVTHLEGENIDPQRAVDTFSRQVASCIKFLIGISAFSGDVPSKAPQSV